MVLSTVLAGFFFVLGLLLWRVAWPFSTEIEQRARVAVGVITLAFITSVIGLIGIRTSSETARVAALEPVDRYETFQERLDDRYVMVTGEVSPETMTMKGPFVSFIEVDTGTTTNSTGSDLNSLRVTLSDGHDIAVDAGYSAGPIFQYDYHNWPSEDGIGITTRYLEHGTPVVLVGKPREGLQVDGLNFDEAELLYSINESRFVFAGSLDEFETEMRPGLERQAGRDRILMWVGLLLGGFLSLVAYSMVSVVNHDPSFEWKHLLKYVRVG